MVTAELITRLKAYVTPGATSTSEVDDAFISACLSEAEQMVNNRCGITASVAFPVTVAVDQAEGRASYTFTRTGNLITVTATVTSDEDVNSWVLRAFIPDGFLPADPSMEIDSVDFVVTTFGQTVPFTVSARAEAGQTVTRTMVYPGEPVADPNPHGVPLSVLERAYLEVGSELYNRRSAPSGISQFAAADGSAIRVARDPMVAAEPILRPFLPGGFA